MLKRFIAVTLACVLTVGFSAGKTAFADPVGVPALNGTFDLVFDTSVAINGEELDSVIIHLDEALAGGIDEADVKDAFTASRKDPKLDWVKGMEDFGGDYMAFVMALLFGQANKANYTTWVETKFDVQSAVISADRQTVTLGIVRFPIVPDEADAVTGMVLGDQPTVYTISRGDTPEEGLAYSGASSNKSIALWRKVLPATIIADGFNVTSGNNGLANYRVFEPNITDPAKAVPVIVWLHGAGDGAENIPGGTDRPFLGSSYISNYGTDEVQSIFGENGAFVIVPQGSLAGEGSQLNRGGHTPSNVVACVEHVIATHPEVNFDRSRVYIGGLSLGGKGVWDTIIAYPDYFAAAFPVAPAVQATIAEEKLAKVAHMPIWQLTDIRDSIIGNVIVANTVRHHNTLAALGGDIHTSLFTACSYDVGGAELSLGSHDPWVYAHLDFPTAASDNHLITSSNYASLLTDEFITNDPTGGTADNFDELQTIYPDKTLDEVKAALGSISESPAGLGYSSFLYWLAAQSLNITGEFDVELQCIIMGQVAARANLRFGEALPESVTADALKSNVTATVTLLDGTTAARTITSATISADRKTVVLEFSYGLMATESGANFLSYRLSGSLGGLNLKLTYTGASDPEVEKFNPYPKTQTGLDIDFRLFSPENATGKVPLILWLHGGSSTGASTGNNNYTQVAEGETRYISEYAQDIFGGAAYVLAPQTANTFHEPASVMAVIQYVLAHNDNIDTNRIYVGGGSLGGNGTHRMIVAYPNFFAAAFPTCPWAYELDDPNAIRAGELTVSEAQLLADANMPIYYITAINDGIVPPTTAINSYKKLIAAGATNVHITLFSKVDIGDADFQSVIENGYLESVIGKDGSNNIKATLGHSSAAYTCEDFPVARNEQYMLNGDGTISFTPHMYVQGADDLVAGEVITGATSQDPRDFGYQTFLHWVAAQSLANIPDTAALEAAIAQAKLLAAEDYTAESYAALLAAISEAEAALAGGGATQEEIDALLGALEAAIAALVEAEEPGDGGEALAEARGALLSLIQNTGGAIWMGLFSDESAAAYEAALEAAADALADEGATAEGIGAERGALLAAVRGLTVREEYGEYAELAAMLLGVAELDGGEYTPASWRALSDVVEGAWNFIMAALAGAAGEEGDGEGAGEGAEALSGAYAPLADVSPAIAAWMVAVQEAIAALELLPAGGLPGGGAPDAIAGGVYARGGAIEIIEEEMGEGGSAARADFYAATRGASRAGTINLRLSYRLADVESAVFSLPAGLAGKATLSIIGDDEDEDSVPPPPKPILPGYKTYSIHILANPGTTLELGDGEALLEAALELKPIAGGEGKAVSLLLTHLDIVYHDAGGEGILAATSISASAASLAARVFSRFDVNRDGAVTLVDVDVVRRLLGSIASGGEWATDAMRRCDLDGNGAIEIADLSLAIAKYESTVW